MSINESEKVRRLREAVDHKAIADMIQAALTSDDHWMIAHTKAVMDNLDVPEWARRIYAPAVWEYLGWELATRKRAGSEKVFMPEKTGLLTSGDWVPMNLGQKYKVMKRFSGEVEPLTLGYTDNLELARTLSGRFRRAFTAIWVAYADTGEPVPDNYSE